MASLTESFVDSRKEISEPNNSLDKTKNGTEEFGEIENLLKELPVLNDYFLLHNKIGKGTFSSVYLATLRNGKSTRKYAVKHLTTHCEQSRVEYELKCLQEIGGKDNVVSAELCLSNGKNCVTFVMPYLPHLKFSDYVIDMDVEETRSYMKNLLVALRRVHSFNIIHRDVKPDNFLYDRKTKQFLLVDFGLAQLVHGTAKEVKKGNENIPMDYSKKRKRNPCSSEDEEKHALKSNKRVALKSKDNNIKISVPKFLPDTKHNVDKIAARENGSEVIKQQKSKIEIDKFLAKGNTFPSENVMRGNLSDPNACKENAARDKSHGSGSVRREAEETRDGSFTPLVSGNSPNGNFVQVRNSRVVGQHATSSTSGLFPNGPFAKSFGSCLCSGKGAVCSLCKARSPMCAPRAGTSGFRPPEVLFKYLHQTTAVDIWASGVVMLCILSGCYPFFKSSSDLVSLAEIMTIFGTERMVEVAAKFGRRIICSQNSKGVDLKKLCVRLRARAVKKSRTKKTSPNEPRCRDCSQAIGESGCLCPSDEACNEEKNPVVQFPESAYDLLYRLMDLDPTTRITAAEALDHPFIRGPQ